MMVHSRLALTTGYNERGAENLMERPVAYLILIREFLGPSPSALSGKKFQSTGTYKSKMMQRCARIFSGKTRSVTVQRLRFFPRFTDKG